MQAHVNAGSFTNWSCKLDNREIRCLYGLNFIEISTKFVCVKELTVQHVFEDSLVRGILEGYSTRVVSLLNEYCCEIKNEVLFTLPGDP